MESYLLLLGYIVGFVLTSLFPWKICFPGKVNPMDDLFPAIVGFVWPISLPIILLLLTLKGVSKSRPLKIRSAKTKVLEYAQSPTKILAEMICTKILAYPQGINYWADCWTSKDGKIKVTAYMYAGECRNLRTIEVNGRNISIGVGERKKIFKALVATIKVKNQMDKAEKEANQQLAALEAVESLLLQPEKETTNA